VQVRFLSPAQLSVWYSAGRLRSSSTASISHLPNVTLETKLHERSAVARELEIFVDEAELQTAFDDAYKTIRPRLSLPGFRPGKAPMSLVKKMHGDAIEGDALEKLAQEKFRSVVDEMKLEPIGVPVMIDLHRHTGEGAHFKIAYEVAPQFDLVDFSGLEVEQPVFDITDQDVDEHIQRVRFNMAERADAEAVDSLESIVTVDMRELDVAEGQTAGHSEGVQVYLNDPEVLPVLKEKLMGVHVGDTVEAELPRQSRTEEGTTENGRVEIRVTKIERVLLPEMNEEYIKQISRDKFSTEEELREDVRNELVKHYEKQSFEQLEENIVGKLLELHDIAVPRTITHAILDQMVEERKQENQRRGLPATYGVNDEEFRERMWPVAEARGKWSLLRDKLIEAESIDATDEDLEELAEKEASMYGLPKDNLLKFYRKTEAIKNRIIAEKLGKRLREKVTVKEKKIERRS
jgi:trigger factor